MEGNTSMKKLACVSRAFTLIELLVVMAIIGILVAIAVGSFRTTQMRGRDTVRKSDLKQISHSLELYYADYGRYPNNSDIIWGNQFTDDKTVYFKVLPNDPLSPSYEYIYQVDSSNQKYKLFARIENSQDQNIDPLVPVDIICGSGKPCNFAVTSANTNAAE